MDDKTKKILLYFLGFFLSVGLVFGIANAVSCAIKKNQHNETRYGDVKVYIQRNDWNQRNLDVLLHSFTELNRLGPRFILTDNRSDARVEIFLKELNCQRNGAAFYIVGTKEVWADPVCANSDKELQTMFMHEIGHAIGMLHVCRLSEKNIRNDCSPVGYGIAVLNPELHYNEDVGMNGNGLIPLSTIELQSLDFAEFNRVWRR
jgi:hypothetical protein